MRLPRTPLRSLVGAVLSATVLLLAGGRAGAAPERVQIPSLATDATGARQTVDGYLSAAPGEGPHPALVFLHGCGGLLNSKGVPERRQTDWAARFNAAGYTVLMVDSFKPRGVRSMCAPKNYQAPVFFARPLDALGALAYLKTLPGVDPARIGLMGWSEGGGVVLNTLRNPLAAGFRAAVAFYPAGCTPARIGRAYRTPIPLLTLLGADDVWTRAAPCATALGRVHGGAPIAIHTYPGAYHDFDWPDMKVHEVPKDRTNAGVVPIEGTNPDARADALERVPAFFASAGL